MLASCLRAVLISSPDTWDWTRMHVLVVMHRRTLYENVDRAKIKAPFYTTDNDILHVASMYRHTLYWYIDPYRWIVTPLVASIWCWMLFLEFAVVVEWLFSPWSPVKDVVEKTACIVQSTCVNVHSISGKDFISPLPFQVRTLDACVCWVFSTVHLLYDGLLTISLVFLEEIRVIVPGGRLLVPSGIYSASVTDVW